MKLTKISHFLLAFKPDYILSNVHRYLSNLIEDRLSKGNARLCISLPPRHGKSELVSRVMPLWLYSRYPQAQVIQVSYGANLSSDFGSEVRASMTSPLYTSYFPDSAPTGDGESGAQWQTRSKGTYKGVGIGGSITGFGADVIIIDDIVKNRQTAHSPAFKRQIREGFGPTLFTRLLPGGSIIVLNTRWTNDDLIGMLTLELDGWEYINLKAIAEDDDPLGRAPGEALFPEMYPLDSLLERKRTMAPYDWLCLYQGTPPDSTQYLDIRETVMGSTGTSLLWFNNILATYNKKGHICEVTTADTITDLLEYLTNVSLNYTTLISNNLVSNNKLAVTILGQSGLKVTYQPQLEGYSPTSRPLYLPTEYHNNLQVIGAAQYLDSIMATRMSQGDRFKYSIISSR